ncbi:MAG: replication-associated recombination protein A [Actinobacteria bacterium]|nr:replication-associated recombination protein A [Actinomycetota bacterium]
MTPKRGAADGPSLFGPADPAHEEAGPGAPLAARMRPRTLEEFMGQRHLLKETSLLRTMIDQDRLRSILLYGPAGTGKTSLAMLIARATSAAFNTLSAVQAGVADVRKVLEESKQRLAVSGRRTVLFIDEVHRFNKAQQDALLPGVEAGTIVFIGATTENPFFSVIGPLLSRSTLFRLEPLPAEDLVAILERGLADTERGLAGVVKADAQILETIANRAEGDARVALNALEAAAERALGRGATTIEADDADDAMRQRLVRYDRSGDQHYDVISAFIKSVRGSDPDATIAWLVRMIEAGEDARFIARRMVILASEDVGLADPNALTVATAAAHAVEYVGLPEAAFNLAQAAIYLSLAPKSNAIKRALGSARSDLDVRGQGDVPKHLRDASYRGSAALGHGKGYQYPHDHPGGWIDQRYMPEGLEDARYWEPEPDLPERRARGTAREEHGE